MHRQADNISNWVLTDTEKHVPLGCLHMRPIQWHLKRNWHIAESQEANVLPNQHLHPLQYALQLFTDASNEGWDTHLWNSTTKSVWSTPESKLHINYNTTVVSYNNKEGGCEIRFSLCPSVVSPFLVQQPQHASVSLTHTGSSECHCRQVVKAQASDPDRMVSPPGDNRSDLSQVAQTPNRPVHKQIQQVTLVHLSGSGSEGMGHQCPQPLMGSSGPVCFSPSSPFGQGDQQTATSKL